MSRWLFLAALLSACSAGTVGIVDDTGSRDTGDDTDVDTDTGDPGPEDADADGFTADEDCDDNDPTIFPGAEEWCDLVDHDCDGEAVEEDACPCDVLIEAVGTLYMGCTDWANWDDAAAACEDAGMHLMIPTTAGEEEVLVDYNRRTRRPLIWLGATDRDREGSWLWVDGSRVGDGGDWLRGEPNDWWGEDCMAYDATRGGWADIGCETVGGFVCELPIGE